MPAKCRRCGALCCAPTRNSGVVLVLSAVGITLSGFLSVATDSAIPLVLALAISLGALLWKWHSEQLMLLTPDEVMQHRAIESVGVVAVLLSYFFS